MRSRAPLLMLFWSIVILAITACLVKPAPVSTDTYPGLDEGTLNALMEQAYLGRLWPESEVRR